MAQQKKNSGLGRGLGSLISNSMVAQAKTASFNRKGKPVPAPAKKASEPAPKKVTAVPIKSPTKPAAKAAPVKSVPATEEKPSTPNTTSVPAPAPSPLPFREISVTAIVPAPHQSRRTFDEVALRELADSIQAEGLLQPIVVRELSEGKFELIAGERRWRAFQILKLKMIPARVVKASDASSAAMTLIENLQRADLNPIEEAIGLGSLMRDFNLTQEAVSERVGKARSSIANILRLLSLDTEIQGFIATGMLSVGHAKVLLGVEDKAQQLLLARRFVETQCSVRVAEDLAKRVKEGKFTGTAASTEPVIRQISDEIFRIEKTLCSFFHTKVLVKHGKKSGKILIEYRGNDELARLLECFGVKNS
ncbi:MAG: ParB/RepB/Spo0J family partition protein [Opitutales bacterium]|nr:ParB/RepB/Spo0J family partition protein [Opitutales bacterium]